MIVFRTEKEFSHFAVETPRMTLVFSAKGSIGIVLSTLQCLEKFDLSSHHR